MDFLGWCSDVNSILNDVDIFALISEWEGLPISILEAMSHGIPVIASDVGGVSEAVLDNETGILVPYKSAKQIATFLERLILKDTQWKKFGKNARLRYENCFTVERMTYRTVESYERAIDLFN